MKVPHTIIWDWDSTLVDTYTLIRNAVLATQTAMNLPHESPEETARLNGLPRKITLPQRFPGREAEAEAIFEASLITQYDLFKSDPNVLQEIVISGAAETLKALHNMGIPMAVCSNKTSRMLNLEADMLGWRDYFVVLAGAQDVPFQKPDSRAALSVLARMNIPASQDVWFIGDTETDMRCARGAGLTAVLFDAPHITLANQTARDLADVQIDSLQGLLTYFDHKV